MVDEDLVLARGRASAEPQAVFDDILKAIQMEDGDVILEYPENGIVRFRVPAFGKGKHRFRVGVLAIVRTNGSKSAVELMGAVEPSSFLARALDWGTTEATAKRLMVSLENSLRRGVDFEYEIAGKPSSWRIAGRLALLVSWIVLVSLGFAFLVRLILAAGF
jgi:hypothetical protein